MYTRSAFELQNELNQLAQQYLLEQDRVYIQYIFYPFPVCIQFQSYVSMTFCLLCKHIYQVYIHNPSTEQELNQAIVRNGWLIDKTIFLLEVAEQKGWSMIANVFRHHHSFLTQEIQYYEHKLWNTYLYPQGDPEWIYAKHKI